MRDITLQEVRDLRARFDQYLQTAEQHQFALLVMVEGKFRHTLKHYEEIGQVDDQKDANAMFRVVLNTMGQDFSEYKEE